MRLAICIPTYEARIGVLEQVLEKESWIFDGTETEIFVYYSGLFDERNEKLSEAFNVNFIYVDRETKSNVKFFEIYKDFENSDFDYIWIIHDHTYFDKDSYKRIHSILQKNYDFIVINNQSSEYNFIEIESIENMCKEHVWRINSIGNCIVRRDTFLRGMDWSAMEKLYLTPDSLSFSHVGLYFSRLAEMTMPKLGLVQFARDRFVDILRDEKYSWYSETVRICTESWISVINKLPECYGSKENLLNRQDQFFLSKCNLARLKRDGFYDASIYEKYKKGLEIMSPASPDDIHDIAFLSWDEVKEICFKKFVDTVNRYSSQNYKTYIFGAGRHAVETAELIQDIGVEFDGFIVTSEHGNPHEIMDKEVMEARVCLEAFNSFVICAVQSASLQAVENHIKKMSKKDVVIIDMYK